MFLLSKIKFYAIVVFVFVIPSILFFVGENYFKQKNAINVLEKSNELTIEYFTKKEVLNKSIDEVVSSIDNNKELSDIEKFNILNDCLFSCKLDIGKGKVIFNEKHPN